MCIPWCILQPNSGDWDWARFDNRYFQATNAGVNVLLTLRIGQGWMNRQPLSEEETYSLPPSDLTDTWDDDTGYSRNYYTFIYELVSYYHPPAINIENEASARNFFQGTPDEYLRILKTAHLATKRADPDTRVLDSGFASNAWGIVMAWDKYQSGRWNQDETFRFLRDYSPLYSETIQSPEDLDDAFENTEYHIDYVLNVVPQMGDHIDYLNFHYYGDHVIIDTLITWIREKMNEGGYSAPLFCNEHGIKVAPSSDYDREGLRQAIDRFKRTITLWANGVEITLWFPFDKQDTGAVGLFSESGTLWLASETLRMLGQTIGGRYRFLQTISSGPRVFRYRFSDEDETNTLLAAWTDEGEFDWEISLPSGQNCLRLTDVVGNTEEIDVQVGTYTVTVDTMPKIIEFLDDQTHVSTPGEKITPSSPALHYPYPNPFNPSTTIRFLLTRREHVRLIVFNLMGRKITTLMDEMREAGHHSILFESRDLPSGMYFIRLETPTFTQTRAMEFVK
jgi:hypothetical protein